MRQLSHTSLLPATWGQSTALLALGFLLASCGLQANSDTGGDQSAQSVGPVFASDCGVAGETVLFRGQCMPAQERMWVPDRPIFYSPAANTAVLHPAMLEAGHPQDAPVTALPDVQDVDWSEYVRWASQVVVLPILKLEEASLMHSVEQFTAEVDQGSEAVLEKAALLARVYGNLELIDQVLEAVSEEAGEDGARLWECKQIWETFRFAASGTLEAAQDNHLRSGVDGCLDTYTYALAALMELEETYESYHPGEKLLSLSDVENQVNVVLLTRTALRQGDISLALRQRIKELPSAVLTLFHLATEPLVLSQSFYPLLRYPVTVSVDGAPWDVYVPYNNGGTHEVNAPLGKIVTALIRSYTDTISVIADYGEERRQFFQSLSPEQQAAEIAKVRAWHIKLYIAAMTQALQGSVTQNRALQASLANFTEEQAWVLALAVDAMGAMAIYGGHDEAGEAVGYQAMHDVLMAQANELKSSKRLSLFTVATSVACLGSAIAAGFVASPIASLAAFGICAVATASGVKEAILLGRLSSAAMQLGYMGQDFALYPPLEANQLRTQASVAATLAVLDVLAMGFDVMDAKRAWQAKSMFTEADDIAPAALSATRTRVRQALSSGDQAVTGIRQRLADIWQSIPKPSLAWGGSVASWDDVETIRTNLRRFTDDEAKLDVLVERVLSLKNHGVEELYSPELTPGQIEWFLDNTNYVPNEAYRLVYDRILRNTHIISWEELTYALSEVWDEFRSSIAVGDQVVFIKYKIGTANTQPGRKSTDFIWDLLGDWYRDDTVVNVTSFIDVSGGGGMDIDAFRKLVADTEASGHTVHLVYADDWTLSGTQAHEAISQTQRWLKGGRVRYHVVVPFSTNIAEEELAGISASVTSAVRLETLSDLFPPTHSLYDTLAQMTGRTASWDYSLDYSVGMLPYHVGDGINGLHFVTVDNKVKYPLTSYHGEPFMIFVGVQPAPKPY
jgi:hypothetical protein